MKKLMLALVAFLAVGASAQTRHYVNKEGVIHVHPEGTFQTRAVEVVPVRVVPVVTESVVAPVNSSQTVILTPTVKRTVIIDDDTADVPLIYPNVDILPSYHYEEVYQRTEIR